GAVGGAYWWKQHQVHGPPGYPGVAELTTRKRPINATVSGEVRFVALMSATVVGRRSHRSPRNSACHNQAHEAEETLDRDAQPEPSHGESRRPGAWSASSPSSWPSRRVKPIGPTARTLDS